MNVRLAFILRTSVQSNAIFLFCFRYTSDGDFILLHAGENYSRLTNGGNDSQNRESFTHGLLFGLVAEEYREHSEFPNFQSSSDEIFIFEKVRKKFIIFHFFQFSS